VARKNPTRGKKRIPASKNARRKLTRRGKLTDADTQAQAKRDAADRYKARRSHRQNTEDLEIAFQQCDVGRDPRL
jgi:hypothetical protein